MNRISRAWHAFWTVPDDDAWYLVEDHSPIGFRIEEQFASREEAMAYRRQHADRMHTFQIVPAADWELMAANLMRDQRFWASWGSLAQRARILEDRIAQERLDALAAVAERGPETGTVTLNEVAARARHGVTQEPTTFPEFLRYSANERARRRLPAVEGSLFDPKRVSSESLPEGVTWED